MRSSSSRFKSLSTLLVGSIVKLAVARAVAAPTAAVTVGRAVLILGQARERVNVQPEVANGGNQVLVFVRDFSGVTLMPLAVTAAVAAARAALGVSDTCLLTRKARRGIRLLQLQLLGDFGRVTLMPLAVTAAVAAARAALGVSDTCLLTRKARRGIRLQLSDICVVRLLYAVFRRNGNP